MRRHHPMEDALWLVEYLSKTNGAKHLLPSSNELNLIQYFSIDVILFLFLLVIVGIKLLTVLCCRKKKSLKTKME